MIKTFVILSAPSTGSSLLAECLHEKIYMGSEFADNGHFECPLMLQLSQDILAYASEHDKVGPLFDDYKARFDTDPWDNPPSEEAILQSANVFKKRIQNTINMQNRRARENKPQAVHGFSGNSASFWGWKDGRTGWVIPIIAPYLANPHYIILWREYRKAADGIAKRMAVTKHPFDIKRAEKLVKEMYRRIFKFMENIK